MLRGEGVDCVEHCDLFWQWLQSKGECYSLCYTLIFHVDGGIRVVVASYHSLINS